MKHNPLHMQVEYDPENGMTIPDAVIERRVRSFIELRLYKTKFGSWDIIDEFRKCILLGLLDHTDISFKINGQIYNPNEYGNIPPEAYPHYTLGRSADIIQLQIEKRKHEKQENKHTR